MTLPDGRPSARPEDRLTVDIACLQRRAFRATLVSDKGNHCQVWRAGFLHTHVAADAAITDFVVKYPRSRCDATDSRILARQYRMLREEMDDLIPEAVFVTTRVDGQPNLVVIAQAVNIWFNIANPQIEEEALGLLRECGKARGQLRRFLAAARRLREREDPRLIDLYGLDNLVMDTNRDIRYVDSFYVFFFEDMLHLLGEQDADLEHRIEVSRNRLAYLERILAAAEVPESPLPAPI